MKLAYEGNREETRTTIRDGFIYTGDIGTLDSEGFLFITDRKKDVIFVKGFNLFPREIEELLISQSNTSSVCVVGKKDDRSGETPVACITLKANLDISIIKKYCEDIMLSYKVPSEFMVLENLTLTSEKKT